MDKLFLIVGGAVLVVMALFAAVLLGTLMGGIAGWAVGLFFTSPFVFLSHVTGLAFTPWQWGAALGFVGGFFRASNTNNCSK